MEAGYKGYVHTIVVDILQSILSKVKRIRRHFPGVYMKHPPGRNMPVVSTYSQTVTRPFRTTCTLKQKVLSDEREGKITSVVMASPLFASCRAQTASTTPLA